jgi:hypothetical protein
MIQALIHDTRMSNDHNTVDESLTNATTNTDNITDQDQLQETADNSDSQLRVNTSMS